MGEGAPSDVFSFLYTDKESPKNSNAHRQGVKRLAEKKSVHIAKSVKT